jgi:alkaline phosphatase
MRKVIYTLAILAASCMVLVSCSTANRDQQAKYIFLFIGDGMGASQISMTESYISYQQGKLGGERLMLSTFPYFGMASTYSADKVITCSSAAGTAISCGTKTNNGYLGVDPNGKPLKSISYELKEDGYKIGLISTAPVNHATSASFYGNSSSRYDYYGLTRTIPKTGFEFFAGAGFIGYFGNEGKDEDSEIFLERNGYEVCFGEEEYLQRSADCEKVILCQKQHKGKDAEDYIVDGARKEGVYTLREMLERGLDFLGTERPFFIMCEGGTIDWAAHENKTLPTINLIREFDEAVALAYEFYLKYPDETLIVVTADHDTGGASLGQGIEWLDDRLEWRLIDSAWNAAGGTNILDYEANKALNDSAFIGWSTKMHTGNDVPVYAIGKGAERFCGKMDNTEIKGKILGE